MPNVDIIPHSDKCASWLSLSASCLIYVAAIVAMSLTEVYVPGSTHGRRAAAIASAAAPAS